ncbi:MAG: hypothetical protein IJN70_08545 [Clostridia bacterium]|nr:hypothetical protein [Clostridia bacterium]
MEKIQVLELLYNNISETMTQCGFAPEYKEGMRKTGCPAYERGEAVVMDFAGDKGVTRFVFSEDRIHMLFAGNDAPREDDSAFTKDSTYLFVLAEYTERDVKSIAGEVNEYMNETFIIKKKTAVKTKNISTVSRSAAKSGALAYDPITFATKLSGVYPELKDAITENIEAYGEFLCEDFFVKHATPCIERTIRENNPQKMKRLFNIICEIYEDGTNEVQSLVCVTALGFIQNDPELMQRILPYLADSMVEPVFAVSKKLKTSKSARMRLENPPKYKPKKQKKPGLLSQLMGGGNPGPGMPM